MSPFIHLYVDVTTLVKEKKAMNWGGQTQKNYDMKEGKYNHILIKLLKKDFELKYPMLVNNVALRTHK